MRYSRSLQSVGSLLIGILFAVIGDRTSVGDESVRKKAEHFAETIVRLRASESIHQVSWADQPVADFAAIVSKTNEQDWWPLLKHDSPRVRALAITAIRWKGNPKSLGRVFALCDDEAQTFDCFSRGGQAGGVRRGQAGGVAPVRTRQTVARFARCWIANHLASAEYDYGGNFDEPDLSGFAEYWAARKNRKECYSWVRVALMNAEECATVRARIDASPPPDCYWTLLGLATPDASGYFEYQGNRLAPHADLVTAARRLGPQRLALLATGQLDSQDPDLRLPLPVVEEDDESVQFRRHSPFPEHNVRRWLFRHADEVFDEADIPLILKSTQRKFKVEGLIAAARLSSQASDKYLTEAKQISKPYGGMEVVSIGLWELRREQELKTILDWYFKTAQKDGWMPAFKQMMLQSTSGPLVLAIWEDERCAALTWQGISHLIRATKTLTKERVVSWDEQKESRPAFGGRRPGKGVKGEYTRDDEAVKEIVAAWRNRIVPLLRGK